MAHLETAQSYLGAGLSVLPAILGQKRPALAAWRQYQDRLPTEEEIRRWFVQAEALCLVTGKVSGNLEMLDFDLGGEAFQPWYTAVEQANAELLSRLVIEQSPSGGWHVVYRSEVPVCGNLKLAQRRQSVEGPDEVTIQGKAFKPRQDPDGRWYVLLTLIETRGEGGLFLCAPSPGYEILQGDFAQLPVLGESERELLLETAWALNQYVPEPPQRAATSVAVPSGKPESNEAPDSRPGDDFNKRGDVRPVLKRHGWSLVKGGDNEYWRRPGKASGSSATLKDGVFYVFSSSVAPFEPNQAYAAFSVYALLEHHGDFAAAAAALRQEGFGGDPVETGDVDLSGLEKQCRLRSFFGVPVADQPPAIEPSQTPSKPKKPDIPDELLQVPGFVSGVMDFCMSAARYPNLPMAFCGAMALQSFLCSRKVRDRGGLRPNLYILALAESGFGKAYPRKINSYVLGQIGLGGAVGNQMGSGQGLEDEIQSHRKKLYQTDEMDHLLRCLASAKESYHSMLLSLILQMYTAADELYVMRSKARVRGQTDGCREIDQPGLVIFGTATPECFFEAMSLRLLTNGLFSRSLVIEVGERGHRQQQRDVSEIPRHLVEIARWWKDYNPAPVNPQTGRKPDLDDEHPTPAIVPCTDEGRALLEQFADQADEEYNAAMAAGDRVRAVLWTRACENATRLALIYACSRDHHSPSIDAEVARWASKFTNLLVRHMLKEATQRVAANPFHGECLTLLRTLRQAGGRMARRDLMRAMHCKAFEFDQMVSTLIQQDDVLPIQIPTRSKSILGYQLA